MYSNILLCILGIICLSLCICLITFTLVTLHSENLQFSPDISFHFNSLYSPSFVFLAESIWNREIVFFILTNLLLACSYSSQNYLLVTAQFSLILACDNLSLVFWFLCEVPGVLLLFTFLLQPLLLSMRLYEIINFATYPIFLSLLFFFLQSIYWEFY